MLGPMGAHVISALRVMTPSEIDRYARSSGTRRVRAMAAGAEDFDLSNSQSYEQGYDHEQERSESAGFTPLTEAEIIPIDSYKSKGEQSKHKSDSSFQTSQNRAHEPPGAGPPPRSGSPPGHNGGSELESLGIFSNKKIHAFKKAKEDSARLKEDSSTVFLLKVRESLKKANNLIIGSLALKLYLQTANADMTQAQPDIDNPEQELAQGSKGILINKKQF